MKTFELNLENLRKGWSSTPQFWFSLNDYKIKNIVDFVDYEQPDDMNKSSYLVSIGYIPYFTVTNEEVIRAFVKSIEDKKLKKALSNIDEKDYVESFWKYFNVYPELADLLCQFEDSFVLDKAKIWCEENNIEYIVKL